MREPPEPTKAEYEDYERQEAAAATAATLRIEGITPQAVKHIVREAVERSISADYDFTDRVKDMVRKRVAEQVDKLVQEIGREQISDAVRSALADGWQETSHYGEPTGKRITLRERLNEAFTKKYRPDYGDRTESTTVEHAVRAAVAKALETEFAAELVQAKSAFRAQVDELLKGKLVASLKEALGLR